MNGIGTYTIETDRLILRRFFYYRLLSIYKK